MNVLTYTVFVGDNRGKRMYYAKDVASWTGAMAAIHLVVKAQPEGMSLRWRIAWSVNGGKNVTVAKGTQEDAARFAWAVTPEVERAFRRLSTVERFGAIIEGKKMAQYIATVETLNGNGAWYDYDAIPAETFTFAGYGV